jgi:hypothetical protein
MNAPYIKVYNELGELVNPITKQNPFISEGLNRSQRRVKQSRLYNNKKSCKMIVTNLGKGVFAKTRILVHQFHGKQIIQYVTN